MFPFFFILISFLLCLFIRDVCQFSSVAKNRTTKCKLFGYLVHTHTHTHHLALWPCTAFLRLLYAPYRPCHPPPSSVSSLPALLFPASSNPSRPGAHCPMPHACPQHDQESVSLRDSTTLRKVLGDAPSWVAWGLQRVRTTHSHPAPCAAGSTHGDLTLSWVETNFPGPGEKERDRAEQPGQPLGHPHGCTQGRGSRLGGRPGAAGSPRSAALLRALAVLPGVSAASGAPGTAPRPASPRHRPRLRARLPHRAQPAWLSQARAPRSRATLGSARCQAQRERSQSSGARGAAESPPPGLGRPISGRRGGSASRAAPAPRSPARGRAHRDLPSCCSGSPGPARSHAR